MKKTSWQTAPAPDEAGEWVACPGTRVMMRLGEILSVEAIRWMDERTLDLKIKGREKPVRFTGVQIEDMSFGKGIL